MGSVEAFNVEELLTPHDVDVEPHSRVRVRVRVRSHIVGVPGNKAQISFHGLTHLSFRALSSSSSTLLLCSSPSSEAPPAPEAP